MHSRKCISFVVPLKNLDGLFYCQLCKLYRAFNLMIDGCLHVDLNIC